MRFVIGIVLVFISAGMMDHPDTPLWVALIPAVVALVLFWRELTKGPF